MAVRGREVKVAFVGDVASLKRATADAERQLSGFNQSVDKFDRGATKSFRNVAAAGAAALGAAGLLGVAKDAFDAFAQTEVQTKAVDKAFGKAAKTVKGFAKTTAATFGIAERETLASTAAFGDLFKSLGLTEDQAAAMSTSLVSAAGDMAMLRGADPSMVLETVAAAFRGEYDSLQRFLPTISDAAIKQKALADTGKSSAEQLTNAEKAMAAFALITGASNPAIGSAGSLIGTAAGQSATLGAKLEDAKAKLGEAFGPFMSDTVLPALNTFADWFGNWWTDNGDDFKKGIDEAKAKFGEMRDSALVASNDMKNGIAVVITEFNKLTGLGSTNEQENKNGLEDLSDNWDLMVQDWKNGINELSEKWDLFTQDISAGMETVGWHMDNTWGAIEDKFNSIVDKLSSIRDVIADIIRMTPLGGTMSFIENALGIDIPGFDTGGVVPGPVGRPRLAVVHGGETVVPTHKPGVTVNQTVNASGMTPMQAVQIIQAYERMALAGVA